MIITRVYSSNTKGRSTPIILQAETSLAAGVSRDLSVTEKEQQQEEEEEEEKWPITAIITHNFLPVNPQSMQTFLDYPPNLPALLPRESFTHIYIFQSFCKWFPELSPAV